MHKAHYFFMKMRQRTYIHINFTLNNVKECNDGHSYFFYIKHYMIDHIFSLSIIMFYSHLLQEYKELNLISSNNSTKQFLESVEHFV